MKKFKEFLNEEMMPYAQTEKGFVGVDNGPVRDNINIHLASVTARPHATPYHAMEMIRKVLAPFSIFPPQTNFLDGDSGHEVFQINQFGDKMGMTNDGKVVVKNFDPYHVYFEYQMNDMGSFDIFCEIVTEDELEEIMSDIEDEMENSNESSEEEDDASDSFDEYKAKNDMNEETELKEENINEISADKATKAYKRAKDKLLDSDIMISLSKGQPYEGKWKKRSEKRHKQAVKFSTYDNKKEKEEQLNELSGKSIKAMDLIMKRTSNVHDEKWTKTYKKRKEEKLKGSEKTKDIDKERNDLGKRWKRAYLAKKKLIAKKKKLKEENRTFDTARAFAEIPVKAKKTPKTSAYNAVRKLARKAKKLKEENRTFDTARAFAEIPAKESKTPDKESKSKIRKTTKKLAKQGMAKNK